MTTRKVAICVVLAAMLPLSAAVFGARKTQPAVKTLSSNSEVSASESVRKGRTEEHGPAFRTGPKPNFYLPETAVPAQPNKRPAKQSAEKSGAAKKPDAAPAKPRSRGDVLGFPLDPYELTAYFLKRWDLLRVIPAVDEWNAYERHAAKLKVSVLEKRLSSASDMIQARQQNLRNAATALYVLGRTQSGPAWIKPPVTVPHILAVRALIRSDSQLLARETSVYEPIREALNRAVVELEDLPSSNPLPAPPPTYAITESVTDRIRFLNEALIAERVLPPAVAQAAEETELLQLSIQGRELLASLAPPPLAPTPRYFPLVPFDTPLPSETPKPRRFAPDMPQLQRPATPAVRVETPPSAPVLAAAPGHIVFAGELRGRGNVVIIGHAKGFYSVYGNLGSLSAEPGKQVETGEIIGSAGTLPPRGNPGLTYELRKEEKIVEPERLLGTASVAGLLTRSQSR